MSQPIDPHVQIILIDDDPHLRQALYQTLTWQGSRSCHWRKPPVLASA